MFFRYGLEILFLIYVISSSLLLIFIKLADISFLLDKIILLSSPNYYYYYYYYYLQILNLFFYNA